jgi:hypothetical protein
MESPDSREEQLLRTTLHAHTPQDIDVDHARALMQRRLFGDSALATGRTWRRGYVIPAFVALALLLMGSGFAGGYYFWGGPFGDPGLQLIGDQHLYQDINQSQPVGPVTITVTKAYADSGRTLIAYDIQVPAAVAAQNIDIEVGSLSVTEAITGELQGGALIECTTFPRHGGVKHCLLTMPPLHPAAQASHVQLTFAILRLYLFPTDQKGDVIINGTWAYTFPLVFHIQNQGTGGPFPQPAQP